MPSLLEKYLGKPNISAVEQKRKDRVLNDKLNKDLSSYPIQQPAQSTVNQTYGSPNVNQSYGTPTTSPTVNQTIGTPNAPVSAPSGFNYSQTQPQVTSPTSVNTTNIQSGGYNTSDPAIQAQIEEMQNQSITSAQPLSPPTIPSPASSGAYDASAQQQTDIELYRQQVLANMQASEDEKRLADELAQFQSDARMGISQLEGQGRGIPLRRIVGQQEQLAEQAGIQEQTLLDRLNLAQGNRSNDLLASQQQLDWATEDKESSENEPFQMGNNLVQLNPETGEYEIVYQSPMGGAEDFTLSEGQQRFDAYGNLIAGTEKQISEMDAYEQHLKIQKMEQELSGIVDPIEREMKMLELEKLKRSVYGTPEGNSEKLASAQNKLEVINSIINSEVLNSMVGPTAFNRIVLDPLEAGARDEFKGAINQLIAKETIDTLVNLKERGGTLGALSDQERIMLQNSASKLGYWQMENGKFDVSQEAFLKELNIMRDLTVKAIDNATIGMNGGEGGDYIDQFLDSFNSADGQALNSLKASIIEQESGGNYNAVGLMTSYGVPALGKYQIMPNFHFSKIGLQNTPADHQRFLNSPQLQDQLFGILIDELAQKYNNDPAKIASAYYGGAGGASVVGTPAGDRVQTAGGRDMPSINQYVNSVLSRV